MKIISFITEKPVIRKILEHLDLWRETKRGPPNKASPPVETITEIKEREYEPFDDGWPVYEEPFITQFTELSAAGQEKCGLIAANY